MAKDFTLKKEVGTKKSYEPRLLGSIVSEMLHSDSPLAVGSRQYIASQVNDESEDCGLHKNTELGCDLKTILHSDQRMKPGKAYRGVLRFDSEAIVDEFLCHDPHFTFVEIEPQNRKRNPQVFNGQYITFTMRDDGSLHPNFKPMKVDEDFSIEKYATGVANELMWALQDLLEK